MQKLNEYLSHARDCQLMANGAVTDEHRKLLQGMANTWTTLAREHARMTGQELPSEPPKRSERSDKKPALPAAPAKKPKGAPPLR